MHDTGFTAHLDAAIKLNRERLPLYAEWSGGRSISLSKRLIHLERLLLPVAQAFDRVAGPYREAGIPLLAAEFASMDAVPVPTRRLLPEPGELPDLRKLARSLRQTVRSGALTETAAVAESVLHNWPAGWPMTQHLLESVYRVASCGLGHSAASASRGLPATLVYSRRLLRLHTYGFREAARLDRRAHPLHRHSIPILIDDLPVLTAFGKTD